MAKKEYTPGSNLTQAFVDLLDAGNAQAQLLMKAIAQHADWRTGEAIPGVRSLSEIGKCSMKTVRRYLKRLKADGLIDLEGRYQDADDENGRQTSSKITLMGYAEWAAAVRNGGTVRKPAKVRKYDASPPGQDDQGAGGTSGQHEGTPPGQVDHGPLDNLSAPHGHEVSTPPGQQGDQGKNLHSNLEDNTPPLPPKRAKRARGARARDDLKDRNEVDQLLASLREKPEWREAIADLIEPVLRQRLLAAPDPAAVVADLAAWAAPLDRDVRRAAAHRLLETRYATVTSEHFVEAVRAVQNAIGAEVIVDRPGVPAVSADGLIMIGRRKHPEAFAAWLAHHEALRRERRQHKVELMERHGYLRVPTQFPPGHQHTGAPA
jgi:hypothetical protein